MDFEENKEIRIAAESAISKKIHSGIDVTSKNFENSLKERNCQESNNVINACDTVEDTYEHARKQSKGNCSVIDIDNAKWNIEHKTKMLENLRENEKLVQQLRELGICYNPEYFKRTYGFVEGQEIDLKREIENYSIEDDVLYRDVDSDSENMVDFESSTMLDGEM